MKRTFFVLLLFVLTIFTIDAQYKKHELELGIGIWNLNEILNTASDIIVTTVPNGAEMANDNSFGSIHAAYRYRITERLGVGPLFAFDYAKADALLNKQKIGKFRKEHYTLAAEVDFIYLNFEKFKMYALAGVGGTLYTLNYKDLDNRQDDSKSLPYFTFQLTPIGLRYGDKFGGFAEFGFGYRGIINAGIFVRF